MTKEEWVQELHQRSLVVRRLKAEARREKVRELLSVGWTGQKIAVALEVGTSTIYRDVARLGGRDTVIARHGRGR